MLRYYAERFTTVEINYTFYRMPTPAAASEWAASTPDGFRFTLKAPRRITHIARLKGAEQPLQAFCRAASALGEKLAVLLFQVPPTFKKDLGVLEAFLDQVPPRARTAFEFRHESWHDRDVFDALRRHGAALCVADRGESPGRAPSRTPVEITADYAYFRLRDEGYQPDDLKRWAETIRGTTAGCGDVFVYFKHEEAGLGPAFAQQLREYLGQG
jgi:uncharacterized protein YecE (DUF72 family)